MMRRLKSFGVSFLTKLQRNIFRSDERYLYGEVVASSLLGFVLPFISTFAIRLGATNGQIGLISSAPALIAVIVTIPIGRFLQTRSNPVPWIMGGMVFYRLGFILFALIPFLEGDYLTAGILIILILTLINIPAQFYAVGLNVLMKWAVSEERQGNVFSIRNIISVIVSGTGAFIAGQWLFRIVFPINYQFLFVFAAILSQLSLYFWMKVKLPEAATHQQTAFSKVRGLGKQFTLLKQVFSDQPQFGSLLRNTLLLNAGLWLASPLYILHYLRDLSANDAWIGIASTIGSVASMVGFFLVRKLISRIGFANSLKFSAPFLGLFPIFVGFAPSLMIILYGVLIYNVVHAFFSISHFSLVIKAFPEGKEQDASAVWMTFMYMGSFIGPPIGVALAGWFGILPILITCGCIAVLGGFSFWIWPVFARDFQKTSDSTPSTKE